MPAAAYLGASSTGHACFPPTNMISTPVSKTYFNGKLAAVASPATSFLFHKCGKVFHLPPLRIVTSGASKTYIEGNKAARIGDDIACGDAIAEGSDNTFIE